MMKTLRLSVMLLATAVAVTLAGCGTGTNASTSAASAASAVGSHFNADLATGYETIAATRTIANGLTVAGKLDKASAKLVQSQCDALRATLEVLNAAGSTPNNDTVLAKTLAAIAALSTYVKANQGAPQ